MVAVASLTPKRLAPGLDPGVGHQFRQTLLGQQLVVQEVKHESANPLAILDRGGDAFGEGRLCLLATSRAAAAMSTVLCDNQGPWLGQIEHLPGIEARGFSLAQRRAACSAGLGKVIDGGIRRIRAAQGPARVPLLPAGLLA